MAFDGDVAVLETLGRLDGLDDLDGVAEVFCANV
jgi:hypothetical protein